MQNLFLILQKFGFYWLAFFGIIIVRYFLVAGGGYWFFYSVMGKPFVKRRLHLRPVVWKSIRQDIELSVFSAVFFGLCAAFIMSAYDSGVTLLYTSVSKYGLWYLGVSFVAVLVIQDAYFYFFHRAFHHPLFFKWLHYGHHRSGDPTPWTSFAFDLPEAIIQGLFFVGIVFLIPLHFITLIAVLMTMTVWAVFTHLGFELFPSRFWFFPQWLGKWFIGSTHHAIHHHKYRVHYGLYFTFWDKLLGTHDPNYEGIPNQKITNH
ncbi:MAG: sterol desaturase family protein [Hapalosiphonaceae cyanobacterium JJU2]|nr:MAG: sterol desaturase family protein [Hapalosiphonaceae cyanobacterium JJU2]